MERITTAIFCRPGTAAHGRGCCIWVRLQNLPFSAFLASHTVDTLPPLGGSVSISQEKGIEFALSIIPHRLSQAQRDRIFSWEGRPLLRDRSAPCCLSPSSRP